MAYLHPGVYVEEIPSGSKPIEGVGTSTAAFIGFTDKGPMGEPNLISKWDDYVTEYGGIRNLQTAAKGDPMGLSVSAFFQNGGKKAYIVRITEDWQRDDSGVSHAEKAVGYTDNPQDSANKALKFTAVNEGAWANGIIVKLSVSELDSNLYDVALGRNNEKGEFAPIESFAGVSLDETNPLYISNVIDGVSDLVTVEMVANASGTDMVADDYIGSSTSGELKGVSLDFSSLIGDALKIKLTLDGGTVDTITLTAKKYTALKDVAKAIQDEVRNIDTTEQYKKFTCEVKSYRLVLTSGTRKVSSSVDVDEAFGLAVPLKLGVVAIPYTATSTSGDLTGKSLALNTDAKFSSNEARTLKVKLDGSDSFSEIILAKTSDLADLNAIVSAVSTAISTAGITGLSCTKHSDGKRLVLTSALNTNKSAVVIDPDFTSPAPDSVNLAKELKLGIGNGGTEVSGLEFHDTHPNLRTEIGGQGSADAAISPSDTLDGGADGGEPAEADYAKIFTKFIKYRDINIVCVPGQYWTMDSTGNAVVQQAIAHAEKMRNRMVIVDPPPDFELDNAKKVIDMGLPSQTYCVVYYPWVEVANQFYHAERFPGLPKKILVPPSGYAAGMWAKIDSKRGVWKAPAGMETGLLGLAGLQFVVEDDEQDSLNPLGVNCLRSMPGAGKVIWGTRTRATKADPEWRYVPVRRTAIMIEQSIYNGIQWAVFEPNDHRLWSALRGNIGGFMNSLFRVGAFQGEKASDAYFVRCGLGDTMTQTDIDAGQVIVIVGFAPLKPAEFVIVRIQQKVNQQ